jgi:hypothetical protein
VVEIARVEVEEVDGGHRPESSHLVL